MLKFELQWRSILYKLFGLCFHEKKVECIKLMLIQGHKTFTPSPEIVFRLCCSSLLVSWIDAWEVINASNCWSLWKCQVKSNTYYRMIMSMADSKSTGWSYTSWVFMSLVWLSLLTKCQQSNHHGHLLYESCCSLSAPRQLSLLLHCWSQTLCYPSGKIVLLKSTHNNDICYSMQSM